METKFQTSFIPKKPFLPEQQSVRVHGAGASVFMIIGIIVFIASVAGAVLTFVGKDYLISTQEQLKLDLKKKESQFDKKTIADLEKASVKISVAKDLLNSHSAVSEVFSIISGLTIEGVYFKGMELSSQSDPNNTGSKSYKINMKGLANSYSSVAWQSDVFGRSDRYGTNKIIKDPVLSNLSVDEQGNVSFDFSANISESDISYSKILDDTLRKEGLLIEDDNSTATSTSNNK